MRTVWNNYTIPRTRLGILLDHLIILRKKYSSGTFNRHEFIEALGLSEKSGGPDHKFSSLKQYGLVTKHEDSEYSITTIGNSVFTADGGVSSPAIEKVVRNIPLWNQLLNTLGKDVSDSTFISAIKTITSVNDDEILKELPHLKHAYTEDISCITRSPPFSIWSSRVGKTKPPRTLDAYSMTASPRSRQSNQSISINQNATLRVRWTLKLSSDFGLYQSDIYDLKTYNLALNVMETMILETINQEDNSINKPKMEGSHMEN